MNNNDILFSVIVPVYNTEKYIEKSLNSINAAIDKDCEVIIINDGSTDDSEKEIIKFINGLEEDKRKQFLYVKKENMGLADTKNKGIELAKGKYISVVDSDDYISDDFYTIARKYIATSDIIIYDAYVIFEKSHKLNHVSRARTDSKDNELIAILNGGISGSSCNKIIKKELYKGYLFPVGKEYEDTAVTPFILSDTDKIKYIPYPLYYYLQRKNSIVATNTLTSAFYKICNNISDVIISNNKDMKKYKYVINEFFVDRALEMLDEDLKLNKKNFLKNIQALEVCNKEIINYILKSDMIDNVENHYSPRQKQLLRKILMCLQNCEYAKIKRILTFRKFINKMRKIWR